MGPLGLCGYKKDETHKSHYLNQHKSGPCGCFCACVEQNGGDLLPVPWSACFSSRDEYANNARITDTTFGPCGSCGGEHNEYDHDDAYNLQIGTCGACFECSGDDPTNYSIGKCCVTTNCHDTCKVCGMPFYSVTDNPS